MDEETKALRAEIRADVMRLSKDDLWKLHKCLNDIKYAANNARYAQRGQVLKPGSMVKAKELQDWYTPVVVNRG